MYFIIAKMIAMIVDKKQILKYINQYYFIILDICKKSKILSTAK